MLLVIFGAGASYDSSFDYPFRNHVNDHFENFRPPLTNYLFDLRFKQTLRKYPELNPLTPQLRPDPGRALEEQLRKIRDEGVRYNERYSQLTALRFYLRDLISDCETKWIDWTQNNTNQSTLIDQLQYAMAKGAENPILLVTFNYDRLIERALCGRKASRTFAEMVDYVGPDDFQLYKLHGSVDWIRGTNLGMNHLGSPERDHPKRFLIANAEHIQTNDHFRIEEGEEFFLENNAALPAIAIPLESDKPFECPSSHLKRLESLLPRVSHIVSIGWRGMEKHFQEMLRGCCNRSTIDWLIVSSSKEGATNIADSLRECKLSMKFRAFDGDFTKFVRSNFVQKFLGV